MGNLKYPAGLKNKAILAWLGAVVCGLSPLLYFYATYMHKEHYSGNTHRLTYGEMKVYQYIVFSGFKQSILMREALHCHPQIEMSKIDKRRIGILEVERLNRV